MVDLVLTDADAGRTVEVRPATSIELRLPENRTTGFSWALTTTPSGCAAVEGDNLEQPAEALVGAGGTRVIMLRATGVPSCELIMTYRRPWEPADQAAQVIRIVLTSG